MILLFYGNMVFLVDIFLKGKRKDAGMADMMENLSCSPPNSQPVLFTVRGDGEPWQLKVYCKGRQDEAPSESAAKVSYLMVTVFVRALPKNC